EFFAWGAPFWVCGGANFLPDEHIALYQACVVDGDFVTGRQIMAALLPLMHMFEQGGKFVQTIKHGVQLAGFNAGIVRPPLGALGADEAAALAKIVTALQTDIRTIIGVQDQ
ncbi:MAG: dihydrodipicolinate synthase family protein, partial [Candidatus Puniceispirillum sp.]